MATVCLAPLGGVEASVMNVTRRTIFESFGARVLELPPVHAPGHAWDAQRGQLSAGLVLRELLRKRPHEDAIICALTEKDLFLPAFRFIFGSAQVGGHAAVMSLARLRPEFHGMPPDPGLLALRVQSEIMHEFGHVFGLMHCDNVACFMAPASNVAQLDSRGRAFCRPCRALLPH